MFSVETSAADNQQPHGSASLLNILPLGIILLDEIGYVLQVNNLAQHILSSRGGLYLCHNKLRAARSSENAQLRQLVGSVLELCHDVDITSLPIMPISRSHGQRALEVLVLPFYCEIVAGLEIGLPKVVIFIRDPERRLANCHDRLKTLYELTPVEAEVANKLAQGKSVSDLADDLRVQPNTIRIHLKHIYRKTRTCKQSELINLLASDFLLQMPMVAIDRVALFL